MSIFAPILMYWKTLATRRAVEAEIDVVVEGWQKQISGLYDLASPPNAITSNVPMTPDGGKTASFIKFAIERKFVSDRRDVIARQEAELEILGDYINACETLLQAAVSSPDKIARHNVLNQKLERYTAMYAKKRAKLSAIQTLTSRIQVESASGRLSRVDANKAKWHMACYWADLRAQTLDSILAEQKSRFSGSRLADICNAYEALIVKNEERSNQLATQNRGRFTLSPKVFVAREEQVVNNEKVAIQLRSQVSNVQVAAIEDLDKSELASAWEICRFIISELTDSHALLETSELETLLNIESVEKKLARWKEREELASQQGNEILAARSHDIVLAHQDQIIELESLRVVVQETKQPIANRIERLEKVSVLLQEQIDDCSKNDTE